MQRFCPPVAIVALAIAVANRLSHLLYIFNKLGYMIKVCRCALQGNRRYVKCLYVYNKIDVCSMEEVDEIAR